ncbi:MAG TPA: DUF4445 domain-containing protein [Candidatus Alectryocaccomicrobium excrementavium]|uniref:DUF4445 domain-containing protein n=1 Tax=Candidatus Alectryocaccomicrobium excrementavium TaxID=2840668 RepID=A0A9D1G1B9_9FIRM|nr:DUF4445 domain-containing protein [Candidatus Alectryocaccomicrobium excrementavium]
MRIQGNGELLTALLPGINAPCGGKGRCGKCRVKARGALSQPTAAERAALGEQALAEGVRLACQARALGEVEVEFERDSGEVLLRAREKAMAVDPGQSGVGCAIDVGTTTLAVYRVDLATGRVLGTDSAMNPQRRFGADVISRIQSAARGEDLTAPIREALGGMAGGACRWTVVGNPAMMQLLCGMPVDGLGRAPFTPAYRAAIEKDGAYVGPLISGFVGADAVSAALFAGLDQGNATRLLLDVGTNGEMLLAHGGEIGACAAAAGPAFEGAHIACGMGGAPGAIRRARRLEDGQWELSVVGDGAPRGLCGSGLIDAIAGLLASGGIDETGRLAEEVSFAPGVYLTQQDVREVQLAKGAIAAGIELLMREMGVAEIDECYLTGGFGSAIDPASALAIGLLPESLAGKIVPIGNAAGMGAVEMLLSRAARERAQAIAARARYIELSELEDFQDAFVEHMLFE